VQPRDLRKKKNVIIYFTGSKETGGVDTGRTAIRVGVKEKVPLAQLKKKDIIPRSLQGMETDVFPTEEITALAIDRKAKHRPAPGGVSIGHPSVTAGTLGMVVRKAGRRILSNNHVLAHSNAAKIGDDAWQPGSYDGGGIAECIGHLSEFVPIGFTGDGSGCLGGIIGKVLAPIFATIAELFGLTPRAITNKVDAAIARPSRDEDVSDEILEIGKPTGYGEAKVSDKLKKSGRTTAVTQGDVIAIDGVSNVNYGDGRVAIFEDQIITSAMSEGGDSGSAVLNQQNEVVGLLFGGSSSLTIINKISNVIDALGLERTM